MPIVKLSKPGEDEGEGLGGRPAGGLGVGTGELNRVTTNLALADHVGKFVAGEVAAQYKNESLADILKGRNMVMVSGSWG